MHSSRRSEDGPVPTIWSGGRAAITASAVEVAATALSNLASAVPVAAAAPSSPSPSPAPSEVGVRVVVARCVGVEVAVALGVGVPLGVELAVGDGLGVCVAVGGEVLLGVGVRLGVGVAVGGSGVLVGVAVSGTGVLVGFGVGGKGVLVGTGVFADVGAGVFVGAITVNEPLLVLWATPVPAGSVKAVMLRVSANVPGVALPRMSNERLMTTPSETREGGLSRLNTMTRTALAVGSEELRIIPLAPGPRLTLAALTRLASKLTSKLNPLISTPVSNAKLTGMLMLVSPGFPEALPTERLAWEP